MRAGLFQALAQQQLKRDVAISVTNFFAAAEMVAVTDYCATLPSLICRRLMHDPRLKILPAPVDLGSFLVEMAWHVRYRHDPAHRWLRALIGAVITDLTGKTAAAATSSIKQRQGKRHLFFCWGEHDGPTVTLSRKMLPARMRRIWQNRS